MLEKIFKLKQNNTTVKTEILAGLTTFMTMAYIIALNPNLLTGFGAEGTKALWNGVPGNMYCFGSRYVCHGISCQQAICTGSGYGT